MTSAARPARTISVEEAARRLGCRTQTVRNWLRSGKLSGHQTGKRNIWHVDEDSVTLLVGIEVTELIIRPTDGGARSEQLQQLLERELAAERAIRAIETDRDRYRADAATVREAALRVNSAAKELRDVVQGLLGVLDQQSEALTQLLAPATPADLLRFGRDS